MQTFMAIYSVFLGACLGSFANVLVVRLPQNLSIVSPRSRCNRCSTPLAFYDNIPLISFLWLKARCRYCHTKISPRYFMVELLMALLALAFYVRFGLSLQFGLWLLLGTAFVAIAFIDLEHWYIPDVIVLPLIPLAFLATWYLQDLQTTLLGLIPAFLLWLTGFLFMRFTKREGLGFGDVKLLALIGVAIGLKETLAVLFFASVQGLIIALFLLKKPRKQTEDGWQPPSRAIPFAPFLVLAAFEIVLLPELFLQVPNAMVHLWMEVFL